MSLMQKIIKENMLRSNLDSQLSDLSYRSLYGTRQSMRGLNEGIVDLGKLAFDQPHSEITKDMIIQYQKDMLKPESYVDPATGNQYKYYPTEYNEVLQPLNPIDYSTTGRPASEADVNKVSNDIGKETDYLHRKEKDMRKSKKKMDDFEMIIKRNDEEMRKLKTEEAVIDRELKGTLTSAVARDYRARKRDIVKEHADLTKENTFMQNGLVKEDRIYKQLIIDQQQSLVDIDALKAEYRDIKVNIEENKTEELKNKRTNKNIALEYESSFNSANMNRASIKQEPDESDADFITRLQALQAEAYDVNLYKDKAELEQSMKLKTNLKELLRNDIIIGNIIKNLTPEQTFEINKYFSLIKNRFLDIYGYDNKNIKDSKVVIDELIKNLDIINTKPYETFELEEDKTGTSNPSTVIPHSDALATPSEFEMAVENGALKIENTISHKQVYIRIGKKDSKKLIFYSTTTNAKNSFTGFKFKGTKEPSWSYIMSNYLDLLNPTNKDIYVFIFGAAKTSDELYDHLEANGVTTYDKITRTIANTGGVYNNRIYGMGINTENIPKQVLFGNKLLLLHKLFYKNILSIKEKNMHAVEKFNNVRVSDNFVKIIMKIHEGQPAPKLNISTDETQLLDMLLYVCGLHKQVETKKSDHVQKLKDKLKIIEGEISSGNDNVELKKELREVLNKLYHYNVISINALKSYLKQFDN